MSENGFRLEASDWEKSCFENGSCLPAEFWGVTISKAQRVQGAVLAASGRHSAFWELFWDVLWALQGGRARYKGCFFGTLGRHSAFWKLFFFRAAQRVLEAVFFCTLGRHSAFWKRFFDSLPSKESFEPYKNPKFQGTKTEVISILKNARFTGSGAKSWPRAFLPPGWSKLALNGAFIGLRLPKWHSKLQKSTNELKMSKTVSGSKRPTGKNLALRTAPASLQNFRASRSARHSAFKELYWPLQGGTACFGSSFGTFCGHFRAAERVTRAVFLAL